MHKPCKIFIKLVAVLLCLPLLFCSCKEEEPEVIIPETEYTPHEFQYSEGISAYGSFDIGSCKRLVGKVYTLVIFLNDKESSWTDDARQNFYSKRYFPSLNYLSDQADLRGIDLEIQSGQYATKSDRKTPLYYNGKVTPDIKNASFSLDLLNSAARSLGFTDAEYMNALLKNSLGVEQIAYIIVLNKPGNAYAIYDNEYDDEEEIEFVVAFSKNPGGQDNVGSSVLHELLHLFGASDLYDNSGVYKKRYELCKELFPNDIMMKSALNPDSLVIGPLTECLIGWSERFPAECDCPEWWETAD